MLEINDHTAADFALKHFIENIIDIFHTARGALWDDLPFGPELESFFQVFTGADKGSDHADPVKHEARDAQIH